MRLDKYLASGLGLGSRTDVKKMIKRGRVRVDGITGVRPETAVDPSRDKVYVDGALTEYREFAYLMLNKPKGCVSATEDAEFPTVCDYVPPELKHMNLFPMGRLDIDTEGLCVLTNDGKMSHRLLSPKSHVPKTYIAELDAQITADDIEKFKAGLTLEDGFKCKPSELEIYGVNIAKVVIYEGKFHQVKRMFLAVGKNVLALKRIKINRLCLDEDLGPGEIRELTETELKQLDDKRGDADE